MTTDDRDFPRDDAERAWLAALPEMSALDPEAEDRLVEQLRREGWFRRHRPAAVVLRLAAVVAIFVAGAWVGSALARRGSIEAMLARNDLSATDRVLLLQRAGSVYVEAAGRLAGAAAQDPAAAEVSTQTLIGAAQAAARAHLDVGVSPQLVSLLDVQRGQNGAPHANLIWY
ncbi:MAG TPA: hypothetical protein VLT86_03785 [Vicinamibacterales bacterium]|nr:hypothetical protein [Vicinamibacterales bacterium]